MKKLPVLAIEIDGVIRNFLEAFDKQYRKVFIYNPGLMKTEGDQVVEETPEMLLEKEEEIQRKEKELIKLPVTSELINHYFFEEKVIKMNDENKNGLTYNDINIQEDQSDIIYYPKEMLEKFINDDYTYQILGAAPEYQGAAEAINRIQLYGKTNNLFETVLVSCKKSKSIAATYSFLGGCNCRVKKVVFLDNEDDKWEIADAVVDVTPEVFQSRPDDKVSIKIKHGFNVYDSATFEINNIKELYNERLLKQIFVEKDK